jgi:hypothetical protein
LTRCDETKYNIVHNKIQHQINLMTILLHLKSQYQGNDVVFSNRGAILKQCSLDTLSIHIVEHHYLKIIENPKSVR